jgi:dihydroorotate dehydrogenase
MWKWIPAELAHKLAPFGLNYFAAKMPDTVPHWQPFQWRGISFPNRLGLAGGMDKNAEYLDLWQKMGAGFLEVGTITPYQQKPNSGKIIDRDWDKGNLWNRMGFPNHGSDEIYFNLLNAKPLLKIPVFVNIGKNRQRPNDEADIDYSYLTDRFTPVADAFVVNVSSPNTLGLRELQAEGYLRALTAKIVSLAGKIPVLVKLSPDMSEELFTSSLDACLDSGASGFILTNTTTMRPEDCPFPKEGGLSGKSLAGLSKKHLALAVKHLGPRRDGLLLISVGGVMTAEDVIERLQMGADLVQSYSALIFHGPGFFREIAEKMKI